MDNLVEAINQLKKEKNALVMGHYYQRSEIQEIADYIGDSLALAQQAAKTMNIRLLDHLVVTDGHYYSFNDEGVL